VKLRTTGLAICAALVLCLTVPVASAAVRTKPRSDVATSRLSGSAPVVLSFRGDGPAAYDFSVPDALYDIDLLASYDSANDPDNSGECLFGGYVDGVQAPIHVSLSDPVPVGQFVDWHQSPFVVLPTGQYKLEVLPGTTCDWHVTVLEIGPAVAIAITGVHSYLPHGSGYTPSSVVHMGQTMAFTVLYAVYETLPGKLRGKLVVQEKGKGAAPPQSYSLVAAPNGVKGFYTGVIFAPKYFTIAA
jgi:hypothetical protein